MRVIQQYNIKLHFKILVEDASNNFMFTPAVLVDPETPSIINGGVMTLSGPSFKKNANQDGITCVFTDDDGEDVTEYDRRRTHQRAINGIILNCKAICPMPLFRKLGVHRLNVTLEGKSYSGDFEVGKNVLV